MKYQVIRKNIDTNEEKVLFESVEHLHCSIYANGLITALLIACNEHSLMDGNKCYFNSDFLISFAKLKIEVKEIEENE